MKVLVVDDSIAYRKTISQILSAQDGIEVIGEASHGSIAMAKLKHQEVDLITLDMEMPVMNGIDTLKALKENDIKSKVLIFSGQTARAAGDAITALELGAMDIIPKPSSDFDSIDQAYQYVQDLLLPKVIEIKENMKLEQAKRDIADSNKIINAPKPKIKSIIPKRALENFFPKAVVIASSTGGPNALEQVVASLTSTPDVPILIAQHMPPVFTLSLANRLTKISGITCVEAKKGEEVVAGKIYIAPGDFHMEVKRSADNNKVVIHLHKKEKRNDVRPCANFLFESAARLWNKKLLGVVLTGMGSDGQDGAKAIRENGGAVLIQDEETSVVWGMPRSVYEIDDYDRMLPLDQCAALINRNTTNRLEVMSG